METEGQKELEAAQSNAEQGKDIADAIDKEVLESVCNDAEGMLPPGSVPEILKTSNDPVDLTGTQNDNVQEDEEGQDDKYVKEEPITHVKNMVNKKVFQATPELMKRKDLFPCDEDGKLVSDHRRFN